MKVTIKGFIHKCKYSSENEFSFYPQDMSEFGDIVVAPLEFEYEIPADWNPISAELAMLKKKLAEVVAESDKKVAVINQRINDLLCLDAPVNCAGFDMMPIQNLTEDMQ